MPRRRRKHATGVPHLTRQRGKNKFWYGLVRGTEICLDTPDAQLANQRLNERASAPPDLGGAPQQDGVAQANIRLLTELASLYCDHIKPPRHTPKTANKYNAAVLRFVEWAEHNNIPRCEQVTQAIVSDYIRQRLTKGASAVVINRELSALCSLFVFAEAEGHMSKNPLEGAALRRLRLREPRPKPNSLIISQSDIDKFIKEAHQTTHAAYASLFEATAGCGARLDEMKHLDLADIDEPRGYLTITPKPGWTTKGYRYRSVPVSNTTIKALKKFINLRSEVTLDDKSIWKTLQKVRAKIPGIPKFSMHDFRRAWASAMHARGASPKQVSVWLGHSGVQVTERYLRIDSLEGGHQFLPR